MVPNSFGRSQERKRYLLADQVTSCWTDPPGRPMYAWHPPECWGLAPTLEGRRVAIVANTAIHGQGRKIDSCDDVIRMNRMGEWRHCPEDDGVRATIWAGLARTNIIPDDKDKAKATLYYPSCFPEIAAELSLIWSITPFQMSARFLSYVRRLKIENRILVSGSGLFLYDHFASYLPEFLFRLLYKIDARPDGKTNRRFNYEVLLSGVKVALLLSFSGAAEVTLFGFRFYEGSERRPWPGHDLELNRAILQETIAFATSRGTLIKFV